MKRVIPTLLASFMLAAMALAPASAAGSLSDPDSLLPVDIIVDQDSREIRKVYDLSATTDPSTLPMESFERDGSTYECTDILREVIIGSESRIVTQTESVESDSKDMDTILSLLPQDKVVETEEGFTGTLHLVLNTIKTEPSGYSSKTQPITATRSYPNLASADTSHLPKTISEGGRTLTLQDVQWQTDNTYNADDYEIGDRFTAVCTYGGSKKVSYVTGYVTTADYTGEAYRTGVTVIRYTVIFSGTPIEPEEPEVIPPVPDEPSQKNKSINPLILIPVALVALAAGAGGSYFLLRSRKEHTSNEEMVDRSHYGADSDSDGSAGSGTGV